MAFASMKRMNRIPRLRACFLTLLAAPVVLADTASLQSLEDLRRWAEDFVVAQASGPADGRTTTLATAGAMDPRLHLPRCPGDLQGIMPSTAATSARPTVGVRCASPAWTVYIPVTIETELDVLVMRAAAARDSSPTEADVALQKRRVPGIATRFLSDPAQLRGRHLKVAVSPGTALTTDLLVPDILVRRGQRVTLVVSAGNMEVRAPGEAIADASANGRVRVLNLSSRRIVEGQVESADRVRVSL